MKKKVLLMMVGLLLVGGCESFQPKPVQRIPFPTEEYARLPKIGTGSAIVNGQVFLKTMIGEVRYGAGSPVMLFPVTSYSTQAVELRGNWMFSDYRPVPKMEPEDPDPRMLEYSARIQADGEGRLEFRDVPAGEYYLGSHVVWYVPSGQYTTSVQGGYIAKKITVKDGEEVRVILTR